jgi:hypothetical protein
MKRLIIAAIAVVCLVQPAWSAQRVPEPQLSPAAVKLINDLAAQKAQAVPVKVAPPPVAEPVAPIAAPVPVVAPPAVIVAPPAPVVAPAAPSPVTVSSGPGGETTISIGTLAGQILAWIMVTFSVPIGSYAVLIMHRALTNLKIPVSDAALAKAKQMLVNGMNLAAPEVQERLAGKGQVAIKNETIAAGVRYLQEHGPDAIKTLGLDPTSPKAVEAMKAWAETAITDPTVPTPAALDPPKQVAADPAAAPKTAVPVT